MKVWIVSRDYGVNEWDIEAVYDSEEKAEKHRKELEKLTEKDNTMVNEYEVE